MEIGKTLYVKSARQWRAWLKKNHKKEKDIWLIYYSKTSGKKRIPYNDAVDEALCFGWIDSIVKKIGADCFAQRWSPRRKGSPVSMLNKERVHRMMKAGKMTPSGMEAIIHEMKNGRIHGKFIMPKDIEKALKADPLTWENFRKFPLSYRRIRIGWIHRNYNKNEINSDIEKNLISSIGYDTEVNRLLRYDPKHKKGIILVLTRKNDTHTMINYPDLDYMKVNSGPSEKLTDTRLVFATIENTNPKGRIELFLDFDKIHKIHINAKLIIDETHYEFENSETVINCLDHMELKYKKRDVDHFATFIEILKKLNGANVFSEYDKFSIQGIAINSEEYEMLSKLLGSFINR